MRRRHLFEALMAVWGVLYLVGMFRLTFQLLPLSETGLPDIKDGRSSPQRSPNSKEKYPKHYNRQYTAQELEKLLGHNISDDLKRRLFPWRQMMERYGQGPVMDGLETYCPSHNPHQIIRAVAPVGLFHSGTNLLYDLLLKNCHRPSRMGLLWQPPWGKHTPYEFVHNHTLPQFSHIRHRERVLSIVTVRQGYDWMDRLCRVPYQVSWRHRRDENHPPDGDCPYLHPNGKSSYYNKTLSRIDVQYGAGTVSYPSAAHLWITWNGAWFFEKKQPRIMVRLEDLQYRPKHVISKLCHCVQGTLTHNFTMQWNSSKASHEGHGPLHEGLVAAWTKPLLPPPPREEERMRAAHFIFRPKDPVWQAWGYPS